jgi:hypothetical protein
MKFDKVGTKTFFPKMGSIALACASKWCTLLFLLRSFKYSEFTNHIYHSRSQHESTSGTKHAKDTYASCNISGCCHWLNIACMTAINRVHPVSKWSSWSASRRVDPIRSLTSNLQFSYNLGLVINNVILTIPNCPSQGTNSCANSSLDFLIDSIKPITKHISNISRSNTKSKLNNSPNGFSRRTWNKKMLNGFMRITKKNILYTLSNFFLLSCLGKQNLPMKETHRNLYL